MAKALARVAAGLFALAAVGARPAEEGGLAVVYDSGRTVDARPYLYGSGPDARAAAAALSRAERSLARAPPPQRFEWSGVFPLRPERLRPGRPSERRIPGLAVTVFLLGTDTASAAWLERSAAKLRGAVGLVVEARSAQAFERLAEYARARGIRLEAGSGDAIAEAHAIETYPVVLAGP